LNLKTDHAKERNAKDKVLSINVGWQLAARTGATDKQQCQGISTPNLKIDLKMKKWP